MKKTNMWQSWWTAILLFIDQSDKTIRCSLVSARSGYKVKDRSAGCFSINLSRLNTQLQASMGLKAPFKFRTYWHWHFSNPLTTQNTFYYLWQARDQAHIPPSLFWSYTCLKYGLSELSSGLQKSLASHNNHIRTCILGMYLVSCW